MPHGERKRRCSVQEAWITCFVYMLLVCTSECYPKVLEVEKKQQRFHQELDELGLPEETPGILIHFANNYWPETEHLDEKIARVVETTTVTSAESFPMIYTVDLHVKSEGGLSDAQVIQSLSKAISRILHMPLEDIKVSKLETSDGLLKIQFVCTFKESANDTAAYFPSMKMISELSVDRLQNETNAVKVASVRTVEMSSADMETAKEHNIWRTLNDENWKTWQIAVIIACCLFGLVCFFAVAYFLSKCHFRKNNAPLVTEGRQVVLHPVLKPDVSGVNVIQPENKDSCIVETDSEHTPSPCCSPMRMKGKGLLERRGSNASLTLDLSRSQENIHYGTPPKECSTEEYLLSAAHLLSREQLHSCLKDTVALQAEFAEIPMNYPEKVQVAGSGTKNRYKTILPNETSRVQLSSVDEDPLSSYINANYIRGYACERNAYIATQGPMAHTIDDFWSMIWEEKCPIIVMITKLKEKLKVKCESYLPDCENQYSEVKVTILREIPRDGYAIRELLLTKGRESHNVCHFWYTAWPDHKTPDTAKQLLSMAFEVETLRHHVNGGVKGPTVVHCSAGIGRTGCFIAISIGIQQLQKESVVDVLGIVCGLRLDRGGMVQTAEQYEFVHQALGVYELTLPAQSGE